jgi:hypothetical protein
MLSRFTPWLTMVSIEPLTKGVMTASFHLYGSSNGKQQTMSYNAEKRKKTSWADRAWTMRMRKSEPSNFSEGPRPLTVGSIVGDMSCSKSRR